MTLRLDPDDYAFYLGELGLLTSITLAPLIPSEIKSILSNFPERILFLSPSKSNTPSNYPVMLILI